MFTYHSKNISGHPRLKRIEGLQTADWKGAMFCIAIRTAFFASPRPTSTSADDHFSPLEYDSWPSSMQSQRGDKAQCMPSKRSKRERFLHRRPPRARVKLQCTEMHALRGLIANHGNDTRGWLIIKWRCKLICLRFARYVLPAKTYKSKRHPKNPAYSGLCQYMHRDNARKGWLPKTTDWSGG